MILLFAVWNILQTGGGLAETCRLMVKHMFIPIDINNLMAEIINCFLHLNVSCICLTNQHSYRKCQALVQFDLCFKVPSIHLEFSSPTIFMICSC